MSQVIAIDGPAASGKSTVATGISDTLGIPYINTGNMYRSITFYFLNNGFDPHDSDSGAMLKSLDSLDFDYRKDSEGIFQIYIDGKVASSTAIRSPEVTACVSQVSAMPEVRQWLLAKQRYFASLGLIVMEGRDIGTVVFPDAEYKFFVTATPEARAIRRLNQDGETFENATVKSVAAEIAERDRIDSTRATAPLKQADDAILIDSTNMTIEEVINVIVDKVKSGRN